MKTDLTTKLLLAAIAGGLWALAIRPALAPLPAIAAPVSGETRAALAISDRMTGVFVLQDGKVYKFKEDLGVPTAVGVIDPKQK